MVVSIPSLSLIYSLAFLLPGYITYRLTTWFGKISEDAGQFDKTVYTVGASGLAFIAGLSTYQFLIDEIGFQRIQEYTPVDLGMFYFISLIWAILVGILFGRLYDRVWHGSTDARRASAWGLAVSYREEPARVRVVMNNDREIFGEIHVNDSAHQGQDLILRYPSGILRNSQGEIVDFVNLGEYVFLSETEISEIYYQTDLNI